MKERSSCASCLMPFGKDLGIREHKDYCSYCYADGRHHAENIGLQDFQSLSCQNMIQSGIHPWKAKFFAWTIQFAPYWKEKK